VIKITNHFVSLTDLFSYYMKKSPPNSLLFVVFVLDYMSLLMSTGEISFLSESVNETIGAKLMRFTMYYRHECL